MCPDTESEALEPCLDSLYDWRQSGCVALLHLKSPALLTSAPLYCPGQTAATEGPNWAIRDTYSFRRTIVSVITPRCCVWMALMGQRLLRVSREELVLCWSQASMQGAALGRDHVVDSFVKQAFSQYLLICWISFHSNFSLSHFMFHLFCNILFYFYFIILFSVVVKATFLIL